MSQITELDKKIGRSVGNLSPAAARILSVLLISRFMDRLMHPDSPPVSRSYTGQNISDLLGVSANTVTPAMRQLTQLGFLQYNGKQYGWSLIPAWQQASFTELIQIFGSDNPNFWINFAPSSLVSLVSSDLQEEDPLTNQLNQLPLIQNFGSTPPDGPENTVPTSENEACEPENTEVEYWLEQGGIVPNSPKMRLLAQKIQSPEYAKAHVLEHLYQRRTWEKGGRKDREPGTGALIYRLEKGWTAPVMRCEECLCWERECRCNGHRLYRQIPDDLKDIIKR